MSWSGGVFSRVHDWTTDAAAGIDILASRMDAEDDNLAEGINQCINKAGQNTATGDLPMGGHKHTSVGIAEGREQYARASQVQDGELHWGGSSAGTANAQTITGVGGHVNAPTSPVAGMRVYFIVGVGPNTGATTVAINGGSAIALYADGAPCTGGELSVGAVACIVYDGTQWQLISGAGGGGGTGFFPLATKVVKTAAQALASSSTYVFSWNSATWDDLGAFSVGTPTYLTVPLTGRYLIEGRIFLPFGSYLPEYFSSSANFNIDTGSGFGPVQASFDVFNYIPDSDGTGVALTWAPPDMRWVLNPRWEVELTAGDKVQMQVSQENFSAQSINISGATSANTDQQSYMILRMTG